MAWRRALFALALIAIAVRALIPAGFMLAAGGPSRDQIVVTLCSSHGGGQAVLDLATGQLVDDDAAPSDDAGSKDAPCVFAAAALLAPPMAAPVSTPALHFAVVTPERFGMLRPGQGLAAPPPWSTGPPQTA